MLHRGTTVRGFTAAVKQSTDNEFIVSRDVAGAGFSRLASTRSRPQWLQTARQQKKDSLHSLGIGVTPKFGAAHVCFAGRKTRHRSPKQPLLNARIRRDSAAKFY